MKAVLAFLVLVLISVPSRADHCVAPVQKVQQVQQYAAPVKVVQQHAAYQIVTPYVQTVRLEYYPVAVTVPLYSVTAVPPDGTQELVTEIRALRSRVESLQAIQPMREQLIEDKPPLVMDLRNQCGRCHGDQADKKGGGFRMFRGQEALPLSEDQLLACIQQVTAGKMPKGGPISNGQRLQLTRLLK
jgi:hypothetical protein